MKERTCQILDIDTQTRLPSSTMSRNESEYTGNVHDDVIQWNLWLVFKQHAF